MQYQSSKGAALIISLVMLTAVTFLAVVSLQRSTLQVRMVGNTQMKEQVFHTAMSELEANFQSINEGTQDVGKLIAEATNSVVFDEKGNPLPQKNNDGQDILDSVQYQSVPIATGDAFKNSPVAINTSVLFLGNGAQNTHTFSGGSSVGKFIAYKFELNSIASLSGSIASDQILGITYLAPGN